MRTFHSKALVVVLASAIFPLAGTSTALGCEVSERKRGKTRTFEAVLERSCAGKRLLALAGGTKPALGARLVGIELEREVTDLTGIVVEADDADLVDSARALRKLRRSRYCTAIIALMVLLDEWSVRASGGEERRRRACLVERLRRKPPPRRQRLRPWLERNHPILFESAAKVHRLLERKAIPATDSQRQHVGGPPL